MLNLFVGCASEDEDLARQIATRLLERIPTIRARPWRTIFVTGDYTATQLIHEAARSHLSLLLMCANDRIEIRGEPTMAPRDNVVLEAGMFLSQVGIRRVAFVIEEGIRRPTDLAGLQHVEFSRGCKTVAEIADEVSESISLAWSELADPEELGLDDVFLRTRNAIAAQWDEVIVPDASSANAVCFDNTPCRLLYINGLKTIRNRFWTTSFLTSAFWTGGEAQNILDANRSMLRKVKKDGGSVRRVFLIPVNSELFLDNQRAEIRKFRNTGDIESIRETNLSISNHLKYIEELSRDGCETRIAYDVKGRSWSSLMRLFNVGYRPNDTEIAIYDDRRVDLFSGGSKGVIDSAMSFNKYHRDFPSRLAASERYFSEIWDLGTDAPAFLGSWERATFTAAHEIDYKPNWLIRYDYRLSARDRALKDAELEATLRELASIYGKRKIDSCLDIGSCTGRYPIELLRSGRLSRREKCIAIENDQDALEYMVDKLRYSEFDDVRVDIVPQPGDFLRWENLGIDRRFDLITCMLGTVSHLAAPGPRPDVSGLDQAISLMSGLLTPNGTVIIGAWNRAAIERRDFLGIYTEHDLQSLARWSPRADHLSEILARHGLTVTRRAIEGRIDLYCCRRVA